MSNDCPLCSILQREAVIYENSILYLVSTKDTKGHKVRVMVVVKEHSPAPYFGKRLHAIAVITNYMTKLMGERDWYLVEDKYASIKDHWHRIACDEPLEDEADLKFVDTPKIVFPIWRK